MKELIFIPLATVIIITFLPAILKNIKLRLEKNLNIALMDDFSKKLFKPIAIMMLLCGVFYFLALSFNSNTFINKYIIYLYVILILCFSWIFFIFKKNYLYYWEQKNQKLAKDSDKNTLSLLNKGLTLAIIIPMMLLTFATFGIKWATLATLAGAGGISISFATKDIFSNFFSGIVIYLTKPFKIGDKIFLNDKKISGEVSNIGLFSTLIIDSSARPVFIPNIIFSKLIVSNISEKKPQQFICDFKIRFKDVAVAQKIIYDIKQMLLNQEEINISSVPQVNLNSFNDIGMQINVMAEFNINAAGIEKSKNEIMQQIEKIVSANGAQFANPYPCSN